MNRIEALRALGLDEDATNDDIKVAYKETVQILHPDKFANNKKLQERATEQFKNLQEAYEYLTSGKGSKNSASKNTSHRSSASAGEYATGSQTEARMAGIAAARMQLVKQRDVAIDERRTALMSAVIGGIVALIAGRRPIGLFGIVAALASATAIWGVTKLISAQRTINTLTEHINELKKEEQRLTKL